MVVVGGVADSTMPFDPDKSAASSLFVEHLEDATPSHEDMEVSLTVAYMLASHLDSR